MRRAPHVARRSVSGETPLSRTSVKRIGDKGTEGPKKMGVRRPKWFGEGGAVEMAQQRSKNFFFFFFYCRVRERYLRAEFAEGWK